MALAESIVATGVFIFMILHPSYLGLRESLSLLPITLLSLPVFIGLWGTLRLPVQRRRAVMICLTALFYLLLKVYRGNDSYLHEGDRDDGLVQLASGVLQGHSRYDQVSFEGNRLTTGPTSVLMAVPFVALWGHTHVLSVLFFLCLMAYFWRHREDPWLVVSLSMLVFLPTYNWSYWEESSEIAYGWVFLIPAVLGIERSLETGSLNMRNASVYGLLMGLAVGVRISYAIPVVFLTSILLRYRFKLGFVAGLVSLVAFGAVCLPFIWMSSWEAFVNQWMRVIWLGNGVPSPVYHILTVSMSIAGFFWRKTGLPLTIVVALAVFLGDLSHKLAWLPWHTFNWGLPFVVWGPLWAKRRVHE